MKEWMEHLLTRKDSKTAIKYTKLYMQLENIVYEMKEPCMLDVKLGLQSVKKSGLPREQYSLTPTHKFRMCGCEVLS
jgi:hypothetical protein